ncbi:MAG: hypothetical protein HYU64_02090, partial [Armatimonadetes bacterium]|nr:hypothetical protein [Armatimonadota bacterium]
MGLNLAFFAIGASAAIGQILILRELLALGSGNELTTGIGFALWLTGGALGSFLAVPMRGSPMRDTEREKGAFFSLLGLSGIPLFT